MIPGGPCYDPWDHQDMLKRQEEKNKESDKMWVKSLVYTCIIGIVVCLAFIFLLTLMSEGWNIIRNPGFMFAIVYVVAIGICYVFVEGMNKVFP